jgi:hypothetical protein
MTAANPCACNHFEPFVSGSTAGPHLALSTATGHREQDLTHLSPDAYLPQSRVGRHLPLEESASDQTTVYRPEHDRASSTRQGLANEGYQGRALGWFDLKAVIDIWLPTAIAAAVVYLLTA